MNEGHNIDSSSKICNPDYSKNAARNLATDDSFLVTLDLFGSTHTLTISSLYLPEDISIDLPKQFITKKWRPYFFLRNCDISLVSP